MLNRWEALGLAALVTLGSCRESQAALPSIPAQRVLASLLAQPGSWRCIEPGERPPIDFVRPSGGSPEEALPALVLRAPVELRFRVPELPDDARLRYAACVRSGHYRGGSVSLRWEQDGRIVGERALSAEADLDLELRRWWPAELAQLHEGELTLKLEYTGDADPPPEIGLAVLEFRQPLDVRRTLASRKAPNVVLVVIDTLRADRLAAYGNTPGISPSFDDLARDGTLFERAYSSSSWTAPSTASILTSLAPPAHGVTAGASVLSPGLATLAEVLQEAGFTTGGFSANPLVSRTRNYDQGFETFKDYRWKQGEEIADDILEWLAAESGRRFFLYVHLVDPHHPYAPAPRFAERYAVPGGDHDEAAQRALPDPSASEEARRAAAASDLVLYDGEVASADWTLGRITEELALLGLEDQTVICVTSDHGEEFLEHGLRQHSRQLYRESVHVPLLFRGPGVPAGVRVGNPVPNQHVAATLLGLAGVALPAAFERTDLMDVARGAAEPRGPVFFSNRLGRFFDEARGQWSPPGYLHGVVNERWLLIWSPARPAEDPTLAQPPTPEHLALFDLSLDPDAHANVAHAHPDVVAALQGEIRGWIEQNPPLEGLPLDEQADNELLRALGYVDEE